LEKGSKWLGIVFREERLGSLLPFCARVVDRGNAMSREKAARHSPEANDVLARAARLHQSGQLEQARALYLQILSTDPRNAACLHLLGLEEYQAGRVSAALHMLDRAVALEPNNSELQMNRVRALEATGAMEAALAAARQVIRLDPARGEAWALLGRVCLQMQQWEQAREAWVRVVALEPHATDPLLGLARAFYGLGEWAQAIDCYEKVLAFDPGAVVCWHDLGTIHTLCGHYAEAERCYRRLLAQAPDRHGTRLQLAMVQLLQGNFAEGLVNFEARNGPADPARWQGEPLAGQRILLYAEQGYGDTIQCVRFAPAVARDGCEVVLGVTPPLTRLLRASFPAMIVVEDAAEAKAARSCALMSLPHLLGVRAETIPAVVPYLRVPEEARVKAKRIAWAANKLRVGLVWAGNPAHVLDRFRSIPLEALRPLCAVPAVQFYSLQMGAGAAQLEQSDLPIIDLRAQIGDMADTAALLEQLDLLIAVDTAVLHLAGALARPAWILTPAAPDWRWLLEREDSPWYPTLRLFRQRRLGDWAPVIARVDGALRERAQQKFEETL
jgi:tetratricopeptide (TPR) repeat protein